MIVKIKKNYNKNNFILNYYKKSNTLIRIKNVSN